VDGFAVRVACVAGADGYDDFLGIVILDCVVNAAGAVAAL
jgi:hypothetical protein